ncbi:hypothetical protein UFOVP733_47 [uncultured Caudovirales phage]|uniref:Uncharacterized protein n=1 Tax=uncultured Caudovirales phage TaxID=2100421 RepID=A0A6J5NV11_9CAUD|nr:hypothetical protein UFOVP733_47 [uncultured Caudovirales phage]CAB5224825.1 hypothetical protein UFOVP743_12 [uncultured Caudovirales phage]
MEKNELKKIISELINNNDIYFEAAPSNDPNKKVSEMTDGSPMQGTDYIPVVRTVDSVLTNFKVLASTIPGSLDPFDAKVDGIGASPGCYATLTAAITAGANFINWITSSGPENAVINITKNIFIFLHGANYHLFNLAGFNISQNCTLTIVSPSEKNLTNSSVGATFLCNSGSNNFFAGLGKILNYGVTFIQGGAGGLLDPTLSAMIGACQFQPLGTNNKFVNLQTFGSKVKNCFIIGQAIGAEVDNSLVIGNGCEGENIEYYNSTGSTGTHITVQPGGKLSGIKGSGQEGAGGFPLVIDNQGYLERIYTSYPISPVIQNDGGIVANTMFATATGFAALNASIENTGNSPKMQNINFVNADISIDAVALNTTILSCETVGGTYINYATNTQGFANSGGLLPNSVNFLAVANTAARLALTSSQVKNDQMVTQDSDKTAWIAGVSGATVTWYPISSGVPGVNISPFQAKIDGIGTLPNFYLNLGSAYTAGKTYDDTIANVTETADIEMSSTDQIYLLVGQQFTWDLSDYAIKSSGGNDFGLTLADGSATFQYKTAGQPFQDFDNLSSIVITGNGGIIQNNSSTVDSYIYSLGELLADNLRFLLPNISGGGFKTNHYTQLSGIKFTGGGINCENSIISNGGKLSSIGFYGNNWKPNGFLNDIGTDPTIWDTVDYNVDLPMSFYLFGQAINVVKNNFLSSAFLTVVFSSNSTLTNSYVDAAVLTSGITGCKVFGGTLTTLSLASDNTTDVVLVGVTIPNNTVFYGSGKLIGCKFEGGGSLAVGANFTITGCTSGASTTFSIPAGATAIRAGNDNIIGNDYGGSAASIEFYDAEVDGVGTLPHHYATWNDAISVNPKTLLVTANTSLTADITLANDIFIQFKDGAKLNPNNYQIIQNNFVMSLSSNIIGDLNIVAPATQNIPPIQDNSGNKPLLILDNVGIDLSLVTTNSCEIGGTSCVFANNARVLPGNADRCGIAVLSNNNFNGYLINSSIACFSASGTLTNMQRVLYVDTGTTNNNYLQIDGPPASNIIIDVQAESSVNNTAIQSNDGFFIHNAGQIKNLDNLSDCPINVLFTTSVENDPCYFENVNLGNGNIDFNSLSNMTCNNTRLGSWSNFSGSNIKLNNTSLSFLSSLPTLTVGGSNNTINQLNSPNPALGENADYATLTVTGSSINLSDVRVNTLNNNGNNTSLISCSASNWSETGTGRQSAGCQGAIPNSYISLPFNSGGWQFSLSAVENNTVTLVAYAGCNGVLLGIGEKARALTTAGTFGIEINGTPVVGLTAIAPTTTGSYTPSTSANTFVRGNTITITYTGTLAVLDHAISLDVERSS